MEELQYGYPYPDELKEEYESEFIRVFSPVRLYVITAICIFIATFCLVMFMIYGGLVTPVVGAVALFAAAYVMRTKTDNAHLLEMYAYESYIQFDYYSAADDRKYHLSLSYPAIISCKIDEDNYTSVKLTFRKGKENFDFSVTRLSDGKEIDKSKKTSLFIRLNEGTPEQEFFLYIAPKLFKVHNDHSKINKRFGSHENFRKIYYGENLETEDGE